MLTKERETTEPWGAHVGPLAPFILGMNIGVFVIALLLMCITEATVIHGLWSIPMPHISYAKRFYIPLFVLFPALFGLITRVSIAQQSKRGQISLSVAAQLQSSLGTLLVFTYIALSQLANVAF